MGVPTEYKQSITLCFVYTNFMLLLGYSPFRGSKLRVMEQFQSTFENNGGVNVVQNGSTYRVRGVPGGQIDNSQHTP